MDSSTKGYCYRDAAVPESAWIRATPLQRKTFSEWRRTLFIPVHNPLGDSTFYACFEFETDHYNTLPDFEELLHQYLTPYLESPAVSAQFDPLIHFKYELNTVLDQECRQRCALFSTYVANHQSPPACYYEFTKGESLDLYLVEEDLRGPWKRRSRANTASNDSYIMVHDLRFLGHPVNVVLNYKYHKHYAQQQKLRALPAIDGISGSNHIRYSVRLVQRVNEALVDGQTQRYISEAAAIPVDSIARWRKRELRRADKQLPTTTMEYNVNLKDDFATYSTHHTTFFEDESGQKRMENYVLVFRSFLKKASRLVAVYHQAHWDWIGKIAAGMYDNTMQPPPLSPQHLFNLAFDILSSPGDEFSLDDSDSASPLLGALLFFAAHPRASKRIFSKLYTPAASYVQACYECLLDKVGSFSFQDLPNMLLGLKNDHTSDPIGVSGVTAKVWHWRKQCELMAARRRKILPSCSSAFPVSLPTLTPTANEMSLMEWRTRLLLYNPLTLSSHYQKNPDFVAFHDNGDLNYINIVPGIDVNQLNYFVEHGFFDTLPSF